MSLCSHSPSLQLLSWVPQKQTGDEELGVSTVFGGDPRKPLEGVGFEAKEETSPQRRSQ